MIDAFEHVEAGDRLHMQIEKHQVRPKIEKLVKRRSGVGLCDAVLISGVPQNSAQRRHTGLVVIDNENLRGVI